MPSCSQQGRRSPSTQCHRRYNTVQHSVIRVTTQCHRCYNTVSQTLQHSVICARTQYNTVSIMLPHSVKHTFTQCHACYNMQVRAEKFQHHTTMVGRKVLSTNCHQKAYQPRLSSKKHTRFLHMGLVSTSFCCVKFVSFIHSFIHSQLAPLQMEGDGNHIRSNQQSKETWCHSVYADNETLPQCRMTRHVHKCGVDENRSLNVTGSRLVDGLVRLI